jgi:23S rRNA (uracil1939-C5)-methyltransferase
VTGDLKELFTDDFVEEHGPPDVLIVDPPRAGMHKDVVAQIAALAPERFVYVSCNPTTQARDIERLRDTYRIDAVQPVDMFPHTPHVETVVRLSCRS